jgi:hypothetical protein
MGDLGRTEAAGCHVAHHGWRRDKLTSSACYYVTTTEQIGRAMIHVARHGAPMQVIETRNINALG